MNPLATQYLGLTLANPLIAGASPLSRTLDHARRLEDAGIGALVMHSLFEEELIEEEENWLRFRDQAALGHAEADGFLPDHPGYRNALERYVEQIQRLKTALAVPVIASLNGVSRSGWLHHAQALADAGSTSSTGTPLPCRLLGSASNHDAFHALPCCRIRGFARKSLPGRNYFPTVHLTGRDAT